MKKKKPFERSREVVVVGVDSETQHGPPISLQFHSDDRPTMRRIYQTTPQSATAVFFKYIERHCDTETHYRFYGHYLDFDMLSFLWNERDKLVENCGAFEFTYGDYSIVGCYGRPTFARITSPEGLLVEIVDSALWFRGSLDNAAAQYCPDLRKLERPVGLGDKWFSVRDSAFSAYAMRDAEIAARLGRMVEEFHSKLNLRPSMSLASQAAQIFKLHYVSEPIMQCPKKFIEPAISSYHGGKNNLVKNAAPAWHTDAAMYDISSAYPYAMSELPSFDKEDDYHEAILPVNVKSVPTPGIYKVTGKLAPCNWPIFFTHDFKPLRNCSVADLWVHGYELNEALRTGEFKPTERITGCYYNDATRGESATARFARDFYRNKSEATNPTDRYMYKILLNCLSGKFIQTRQQDMLGEDGKVSREHVAGGLFHPFIAGAIPAHTRGVVHRIEHAYKAHHTATDGIMAQHRKRMPNVGLPEKGLGSLNVEMVGNIVLLRTKLYIGYSKEGPINSRIFSDWKIHKYALHGFQGNVGELEEMIASGRRWYIANHRIGLREALKHDVTPNQFVKRQMMLQVGGIK